jgi:hypothetical protein
MAKNRTKLQALVRRWEKARPYTLEALVIRTAAYLSGVRDVPKGVISALDSLGAEDGKYLATYVSEVTTFLRELEQLEKLEIAALSGDFFMPALRIA